MRYQFNRLLEKFQVWVAWKMPHWLVKWCSVRLMAHATATDEYCHILVPDLTCVDALRVWR